MKTNEIHVTHHAPGYREVEIKTQVWTLATAHAYVDRTQAIVGTVIRVYVGDVVIREKICDPR